MIKYFQDFANAYDFILFDIWGVIYQGGVPYENVVQEILAIAKANKKIVFLSNSPRPSSVSVSRFATWGIKGENIFFYTSGDLVREQLVSFSDKNFRNLGPKLFHLGEHANNDLLGGIEVSLADKIEDADFILSSLFANEGEDLTIYDKDLKIATDRDIPLICANPDVIVPGSNNEKIYCAGYFARKYEEMGGRVFYYGKPHKAIYEGVKQKYLSNAPLNKILMVGDTIETDILGANNFGIDSALVLTGNGIKFRDSLELIEKEVAKPTWITYGVGVVK